MCKGYRCELAKPCPSVNGVLLEMTTKVPFQILSLYCSVLYTGLSTKDFRDDCTEFILSEFPYFHDFGKFDKFNVVFTVSVFLSNPVP